MVEESLVYDAVLQWMRRNDSSTCPVLVDCVRLTEMDQQRLIDLTDEGSNCFLDNEVLKALKIQMKPLWEQMKPRGKKGYLIILHPKNGRFSNDFFL